MTIHAHGYIQYNYTCTCVSKKFCKEGMIAAETNPCYFQIVICHRFCLNSG